MGVKSPGSLHFLKGFHVQKINTQYFANCNGTHVHKLCMHEGVPARWSVSPDGY